MCLYLLANFCDEMWYVPDDKSKGVKAEVLTCKVTSIPCYTVDSMLKKEKK